MHEVNDLLPRRAQAEILFIAIRLAHQLKLRSWIIVRVIIEGLKVSFRFMDLNVHTPIVVRR